MAPPISVLTVDDNPIFRRILTRFLEERSGFEVIVVGSVDGGEKALEKAPRLKPRVILVDLAMPGLHGLELIPRLREVLPSAAIIVLTLMDPASYSDAVKAAGADGFVSKASLESDLLPMIMRCVRGGRTQGIRENQPAAI